MNTPASTPADVLVIFGITGDLAKKMTFRSLYRLERRRLLDCPIVGVALDDWSDAALRDHARSAIETAGETIDEDVFGRFAQRLSMVSGDFADAKTYERVAKAIEGAPHARVLPGDPAVAVRPGGRGTRACQPDRARQGGGGEAVRPRSGVGAGAQRPAAQRPRGVADLPHRPLSRQGTGDGHHVPAVRQLDLRAAVEPRPDPVRADHHGRELRGRGPGQLLRPRRGAARRGAEPPAAAARAVRRRAAERRRCRRAARQAGRGVPGDARRPTPSITCAASTTATDRVEGVQPDSQTETFAALRLEIDNWRWSGVPFFIRAGKALPVRATEIRVIFKRRPSLAITRADARPQRTRAAHRSQPGRRSGHPGQRAGRQHAPAQSTCR